jgi:GntR family transcriptional regulator
MLIDKGRNILGRSSDSAIAFMLDSHSGIPAYLQIVQQVEAALSLGYLVEGDQLPTVKCVVSSVAINPNTVLKAYRELESRGVVAGRPGLGTFIIAAPTVLSPTELSALRSSLVRGWLREAKAAGLSQKVIVALFNSAVEEVVESKPRVTRKR